MKVKRIAAAVMAASMVFAMGGVSAYALFEDSGDSSSTVMEELSMTGVITRATDKALLITPDDSSLGTSVAVTYANNGTFSVDDKVKVSYSQAPTTTDGVTTVNADSVELVSSGASSTSTDTTSVDTTTSTSDDSATASVADTSTTTTTTTDTTDTSSTNTTPNTGNKGVSAFAAISAVALAAIGVLNMKKSENK
jgi:LPXTG-motif cell wall-anchored protein